MSRQAKITLVLLLAAFVLSLLIRIIPPWHQIFIGGNVVSYGEVDAYYHMRIVDSMMHHFPFRPVFDIFESFPYGTSVTWPPLFDYLIAVPSWLISLGHPTQYLTDTISAILPAIIGATMVFPVFLIGKRFMGKIGGLIGAFLIAILPGEFLGRSMLGYADHHVLETFMVAWVILFALWCSGRKLIDWRNFLCGTFIGLYILSWNGAPIVLLIILLAISVKAIVYRESIVNYSLVFLIPLLVSLFLLAPESRTPLLLMSFVGAVVMPIIFEIFLKILKRGWQLYVCTFGTATLLVVILSIINKEFIHQVVNQLSYIFNWAIGTSLFETQPILFAGSAGRFTFDILWGNFSFSLIIALLVFIVITILVFMRKKSDFVFLVVWTIVMALAMLAQRRFAYYFAVNVAVLTAIGVTYFFHKLNVIGTYNAILGNKVTKYYRLFQLKRKDRQETYYTKWSYNFFGMLTIVAIMTAGSLLIVYIPNVKPALDTVSNIRYSPSVDWRNTMSWIKDNTPDPFNNPDFYYEQIRPGYKIPDSAYSIMAWWDYGHWIVRRAMRPVNASPSSPGSAAVFFAETNVEAAEKLLNSERIGYIVIDRELMESKYYAVLDLASASNTLRPENYYDNFFLTEDLLKQLSQYFNVNNLRVMARGDQGRLVQLFLPDYYLSMAARIYNFDAKEVTPQVTIVITYENATTQDGEPFKLVNTMKLSSNYQEALDYVKNNPNSLIVGLGPMLSPIHIPAMNNIKMVYSTNSNTAVAGIKVYEYTPMIEKLR